MSEQDSTGDGFDDLPFHEYCAQCNKRFNETVLDPTVTIIETDDERVLHSFCDEDCLSEWAADGQ